RTSPASKQAGQEGIRNNLAGSGRPAAAPLQPLFTLNSGEIRAGRAAARFKFPSREAGFYARFEVRPNRLSGELSLVISTAGKLEQLQKTIESVIRGKSDVVELALVALIADGHLLIEDVPGVGKTTLAQAMARSFDCSFQRIQFTSDMLPSDIL